uniref:Uncharacterized protein n=1 Tax=Anopheles dirus TaxID=7168 RepID=A0A182NLK3_9DIPT
MDAFYRIKYLQIIPNPLRPLYQYSLDRKNPRQHTYKCEQNAQILLRLEKDRQKKFGSMGKLHLTTSTGDLSLATVAATAASTMQRHSSITGASVPTSSVSTPTPTPPPLAGTGKVNGNACKAAASVLSFDCQLGSYSRGDNYAEDDSFSEDMIPPPPPPLNRRPSYGYGCVLQPVASGPELPAHADQQPMHEPTPGLIGTGGSYNGVMNQPDLFNFAANTNTNTNGSLSGTLKSTLKSAKSSTNGKTTSAPSAMATVDGKSQLNDPLPVMMVDLMNGNTTAGPPQTEPPGAKSAYPPYYFDDNYLHHQYYYGSAGETGTDVPLKEAMDAGQLYLYHQHHHHHHHHAPHPDPVTGGYIPNYDTLNLPSKYNTIGANGDLSGHFSGLPGGPVGHHASSCNINQYAGGSVAKSNLIASHNHHFSNSISNFNFNPSQYFGSALDPPPGTTIIPGGLGGVMGGAGDGFPSSCSLNGTPNKQQPHPWKHRQCPSRGSSSTGSGSSSKYENVGLGCAISYRRPKNRQMCSLIGVRGDHRLPPGVRCIEQWLEQCRCTEVRHPARWPDGIRQGANSNGTTLPASVHGEPGASIGISNALTFQPLVAPSYKHRQISCEPVSNSSSGDPHQDPVPIRSISDAVMFTGFATYFRCQPVSWWIDET